MNVVINGRLSDVKTGTTVSDLVATLGLRDRNVVAELNGEPLERTRFAQTAVSEGDVLEIVRPVAGG